jgi:hypothetical protein
MARNRHALGRTSSKAVTTMTPTTISNLFDEIALTCAARPDTPILCWLNERLLKNLALAIGALRRCFEKVIGDTGIGARYSIQDVIERNLSAFAVTGFAR